MRMPAIRRADRVTAAGGTVQMDWGSRPLDAEAWAREKREAIHRRINAKGGTRYSRHNSPHVRGLDVCFVRDRRRLHDIKNRIATYQFESRAVRDRFSHLLSNYEDF